MSGAWLTVGLDVLVAVLLGAVIVYAIRLNRTLAALRDGKAELAATIARFDEAAAHAERAVAAMGAAASEAGGALGTQISEATALRDELVFLTERGDGLAARLAKVSAPKAPKPKLKPVDADAAGADGPGAAAAPSETERELLRAMQKSRAAG